MWGQNAVELGEREYDSFNLNALSSNSTVQNLGIYAGIAAGAGAVGLAYGVDASSPVYEGQRRRNEQMKLESRATASLPAPEKRRTV